MSASEKLAALEAQIAEAHAETATGWTEERPVIDALPQIVAVVEAAEEVQEIAAEMEIEKLVTPTRFGSVGWNLGRTLAALDEALEPRIVYSDATGKPFDPQPKREPLP